MTLLAFVARGLPELALLAVANGVPGLAYGLRRYPILGLVLAIGYFGVLVNAVAVANTGAPVFSVGPLVVREGALRAAAAIGMRVTAIAGVALYYSALVNPRDALEAFQSQLGLPRGLAFSVALALRMIALLQRDLEEVMAVRRERGARRVPLTPRDFKTIAAPLLSVMVERAVWIGIAGELRGFRLNPSRPRFRPPTDARSLALYALAALQAAGLVLL